MTALLPINIPFKDWANELRNSFPGENLPIVYEENEWIKFVAVIQSNRCFEGKVIPLHIGFNNWRQWASEFMLSIGA